MRRLALDVDELRAVRHRIEHDDEVVRQLHRQHGAFAGRQFDGIDGELGERLIETLRQIDAGAPENLPQIFDFRQRIRIVRGDAAHARAHREGDFDHLVERRLVARGAEPAGIFLVIDGLERRAGVEHAAAAGTQHVPRQFKQAKPRRVQEAGKRALFVKTVLCGKTQSVDAAQLAIGRIAHGSLDGGNTIGIGRLPQDAEQGFGVAHWEVTHPEAPASWRAKCETSR